MSSAPTFVTRFNYHLAQQLLGARRLEAFCVTNSNSNDNQVTLHWKSKPALEKSSVLMDGKWQDHAGKVLFVDATFDVRLGADQSVHLDAQFGCFVLDEPTCKYVRGQILTLSQLEEHSQGMGIDLHSAPPQAMAGMVAKALLNSTKTTAKINADILDLSLYYADVEEFGIFNLKIEKKTSQFDHLGLDLLFHVMEGRGESDISKEELSRPDSFDDWFQRVSDRFVEKALPEDSKNTASATNNNGSQALDAPPPKRAAQAYQYAKVSNKRKKKTKLSFAKSG